MDRRLTEILNGLAKDGTSGASEMTFAILNGLLALPDAELVAISAEDWEQFSVALHQAKPTIAPIFNVANAILLHLERGGGAGETLTELLNKILEREDESTAHIIQHALRVVKGDWLMTCSYSSTVKQVLLALAAERPLRVTVAESYPGCEGRQFAQLLSENGVEAEIIHDSTVLARMEIVDGTITGADSVTPHGLVNKVGTRILMESAAVKDRPAYAVCGWSKLSPVVLSDPVVTTRTMGPRLTEHVQIFENTPLELFSHIITDRGVLSSADLRMELKMEKVAQAWYDRGILKRPERL